MDMQERTYRNIGDRLKLMNESYEMQRSEWEITSIIGEGGSSVCYGAVQNGKSGRLKEFNPVGVPKTPENIEKYISAYRTIETVKRKNPKYEVLNNYIPHCEILYEKDGKGNITSVFIWTPNDKMGQTFDKYIETVRDNPVAECERKLLDILRVTHTLADCICLLHSAGLLHLDVKPSNFLVTYDSRMEINVGNISMFDINTLYSIEHELPFVMGTRGYCAPEIEDGVADNRSDIYSIGAILFYALAINNILPDGHYSDELYPHIDEIIAGSELIKHSDINSKVNVRECITKILKRCLAENPSERYEYCELLEDDLQAAIDELSKHMAGVGIVVYQSLKGDGSEGKSEMIQPKYSFEKTRQKWYLIGAICTLTAIVIALCVGIINSYNTINRQNENLSTLQNTIDRLESDLSERQITEFKPENEIKQDIEPEIVERTPELAYEFLQKELNRVRFFQTEEERTVYADKEFLGNDHILVDKPLIVPLDVTLVFSDDIRIVKGDNDYGFDVYGTLKAHLPYLFSEEERKGQYALGLKYTSRIIDGDMSITFSEPEYNLQDLGAEVATYVVGGRLVAEISVVTNMYVSVNHEKYESLGYAFGFSYLVKPMRVKSVYFENFDRPYIVHEATGFDILQEEISNRAFGAMDGSIPCIVDYPVIVESGSILWVHDRVTVEIVKGGSITVEKDGNVWMSNPAPGVTPGKVIEKGGKLIFK
ncbi:MAG: protein kinase [Lachnospiraceae bacterium]|nr:protein kinase [Lachnospiraceae bacterium]